LRLPLPLRYCPYARLGLRLYHRRWPLCFQKEHDAFVCWTSCKKNDQNLYTTARTCCNLPCVLPASSLAGRPPYVGARTLTKQHPRISIPHMAPRNASQFLSTPFHKLHIRTA
ncbi:unnamed protein product, partial [Laminaria digitata]